jgi:hypothetical protein
MHLLSLLAVLGVVRGAANPFSQYPLLHIGDKLNCSHTGAPCAKAHGAFAWPLTEPDASSLAAFSLRHMSFIGSDGAAQVALLHTAGGGPVVKYMESRPVCGGSEGQRTPFVVGCNATVNFETGGFRADARVYLAANLTAPAAAADTTLEVCLARGVGGRQVSPLVASTAPGNFSDYEGTAFVFWVRLRGELLKVTAVSAPTHAGCQRLGVQRGLDGTPPGSYPAGEPVLAPLFVGGLPTGSGALPFVAEYRSFYAWSSLANFTVDAIVQQGVDGAWFDSYSPGTRGQDLGGATVEVWSVPAGRTLSLAEAFAGQVARLNAVWAWVLPRAPAAVIWANNFEGWFPYNDTDGSPVPGDRSFVVPAAAATVGLNRPFDGASLESWTAQFKGGCFPQNGFAAEADVVYAAEADWLAHVDALLDAAAANVSLAAMTGSAGCESGLQVYLKSRPALDALHYASYLLGVRALGGTPAAAAGPLLGTSAFAAPAAGVAGWPAGLSAAALNPLYTLPLGAPALPPAAAAEYALAPGVYARRFGAALVLVNPTPHDAAQRTPLNGTFYDATGDDPRVPITDVTMAAFSGRVLLAAPPPRRETWTANFKHLGMLAFGTLESSPFTLNGTLYIMGAQMGRFAPDGSSHSFFCVMDAATGRTVSCPNVSSGFAFQSAVTDDARGVVWVFGSAWDRPNSHEPGCAPWGCGACAQGHCYVAAWSSADLVTWSGPTVAVQLAPNKTVPNVGVGFVPASAPAVPGVPRHQAFMVLEGTAGIAVNTNTDGDLSTGWVHLNTTAYYVPGGAAGCPSARYHGGFYYAMGGGNYVWLARSANLTAGSWEYAPANVEQGCVRGLEDCGPGSGVARIAEGFYTQYWSNDSDKGARAFLSNVSLWNWAANDVDFADASGSPPTTFIYGTSVNDAAPANWSGKSQNGYQVGSYDGTVGEWLASFFA